MKKLFVKILALLALAAAFAGCKKDDGAPETGRIVGEWHYANGQTGAAQIDVYLAFDANSTFAVYQKIGEGAYRRYTGTYTLEGNALTGVYSNGDPWASGYTVNIEADGSLCLTSAADPNYVVKYSPSQIPAEVLNHYDDDTKAEAELPFL